MSVVGEVGEAMVSDGGGGFDLFWWGYLVFDIVDFPWQDAVDMIRAAVDRNSGFNISRRTLLTVIAGAAYSVQPYELIPLSWWLNITKSTIKNEVKRYREWKKND